MADSSERYVLLNQLADEFTELDRVVGGKRLRPKNSDRVDWCLLIEINHEPLRPARIFFTGEMFVEIRIALPECCRIAIVDARVAIVICLIDGVAAPRQTITVTDVNRLTRFAA